MKFIVGGYGIQGKKRIRISKKNFISVFDPFVKSADYNSIHEIPIDKYEIVKVCTPNKSKEKIINFCIENNKHILVEKPLSLDQKFIKKIETKIKNKNLIIYSAYNHRFEPNIVKLKKYLNKNDLGKIYSINLFYGNGTAKLNKLSKWKDQEDGVTSDLIPHLLDMIDFWFDIRPTEIIFKKNLKFENNSYDFCQILMKYNNIHINLISSLCSWRNTFKADIIFEKGSLHIDNLVKWGESTFITRNRKYPSGYPKEKIYKISLEDPTWKKEFTYLKQIIKKKNKTDLAKDIWIAKVLTKINEK